MATLEKQFLLQLSNRYKALALLIGIGVPVVFGFVQSGELLVSQLGLGKAGRMVFLLALICAGVYGVYRVVKRLSAVPTLVIVGTDRLTIVNQKSTQQRELPFETIAAYRAVDFNSMADLRLTLTDGQRLTLHANGYLHSQQDFGGMVRAFEQAVRQQQRHKRADILTIVREKTLFEKPLSTYLLVPFIAVMVWTTWDQHVHHRHVSSSLYSAWGIFSAYVAAWLTSRERRIEK